MRILVVEDYDPIRNAVTQGLREEGFAVDATGVADEARWFLSQRVHDVVLLDVMLPGADGIEILANARAAGFEGHVLLLTAKDEIADRVRGLDAGADDYLVKPFAFAELLARVRALIRRTYRRKDPILSIGDLAVDTAGHTVSRGGRAIELSAREYALLSYLALRSGEVVTRQDIWTHVYDFGSETSSNVIDVYIGYLRRKIEVDGQPRLLHTRRGEGYLLAVLP
jgi:DNA-binding response OmpR family regulator